MLKAPSPLKKPSKASHKQKINHFTNQLIIANSIANIVLAIDSDNRFSYCYPIETKHRQLSEVSQRQTGVRLLFNKSDKQRITRMRSWQIEQSAQWD
ncbi:hypothetical protein ACLBW0_08490 [Enterobacteriaceae bacterium C34A]